VPSEKSRVRVWNQPSNDSYHQISDQLWLVLILLYPGAGVFFDTRVYFSIFIFNSWQMNYSLLCQSKQSMLVCGTVSDLRRIFHFLPQTYL